MAIVLLATAGPVGAQVDGHFSLMYDVFPDIDPASGAQDPPSRRFGGEGVHELRARLFAERRDDVGEHLRLTIGAYVDGLFANRDVFAAGGTAADAIVRPADLHVDVITSRFDLRIGASRVVWGRLDEFLPTDVVNPIDLSRFMLEGRSEGRLPVGMVRGRLFLPRSSTFEAIVVPAFRASRFDQLEERTSPFNLLPPAAGRREPEIAWRNVQGGGRFTSTTRRVDWGVSVYRGFRTFPTVGIDPLAQPFTLVETFPRFTMLGGDFETVRGPWGVRGEVAAFVQEESESVEGGVGVDRRAGEYRLAGNALWSSEEGVSLVIAADRSFARETRTLRVLTVYDPGDRTAFGRAIAAVLVRENTWLEGSAGIFAGDSPDTLGRLTDRDFLYVRLKVFF